MAMPMAWRNGYNWSYQSGSKTIEQALAELRYEFGTDVYTQFLAGAEAAQNEQFEDLNNGG